MNADVKQKRMSVLEDITSLDEQLKFKMNRRQQAETERKYKLCEEITEELSMLKQARREKSRELSALQSKERKEMKGKQEAVNSLGPKFLLKVIFTLYNS